MAVRRRRSLALLPHPRRNQYAPVMGPLCGQGAVPGPPPQEESGSEKRSAYNFSGMGYSTPKVSTVMCLIFCSTRGRSFQSRLAETI